MSDSLNHIFLNDELVSENKAKIPAVTSGLYYGAGAFETFLSERGNIFKFSDHLSRLNRGLSYLGVSKENYFSERKILDQLKELIKENNLSDKNARVRIQVSLSEKQGYSSGDDMPLISMITATSIQERKEVQSLILAENSVVSTSARPTHLKLSNMLHYRNAYREAEQKGADDAILLNHDGFVAETSIANIFWKKDDVIYTPSDECDILPGIMRNSIIDILRNRMQVPVKEGRFGVDELMEADSIWLTNSTVGFIPVLQIQDTSFKTKNEFLSELEKELPTYKEEYMTDV